MHKTHSLAFYAIAISSVLVLFKVVTAYGESRLQAQKSIGGNYQMTLDANIPNCQQPKPLILEIQQSGIYLNAFLVKNVNHSQVSPPLQGKFALQQLNLAGNIPANILCQSAIPITIQAIIPSPDSLTGTATISGKTIGFTAKPEK
jgi:hypothetical protein